MRTLLRRLSCLVGAVAMTTALAAPHHPAAHAEPSTSPQISWSQLGLSNSIDLIGANQRNEVGLPVPPGTIPAQLTGWINAAVNTAGRIDVLDARTAVIASIPIPPNLEAAPFFVDVSQAQIIDGVAQLTFVIRDYANERTDSCVQPPTVTLSQLATTYAGATVNPWSVADFLPGYLDSITIRVGPQPTREQQQAALTLVAQLTHLYRPIPLRIDVDTSATPVTVIDGTSRRVIEIRNGGTPGLTVENGGTPEAVLVISGEGSQLMQQVQLFADRRVALAQTPTALVAAVSEDVPQSTEVLSFAQLGIAGQASVQGTATLYAGFDASEFAVGAIQHVTVNLRAQYTPVVNGTGSLLARSNANVLASRKLDESGVVDLVLEIPAEAITSNVGFGLELTYIPEGDCATIADRMIFALDPESTVTVTPGTDNRGGFPVLPMAFTPDFNVALDQPEHLRFAAQAINLMGQQAKVAPRPNVVSLDEAVEARTGLLAVTTGDTLAGLGLNAPLQPGENSLESVNGNPVTGVDLNGPLGVIQAFTQNDRPALVIYADQDWNLVERSFDYIRGLDNRWASLSGDVVATGAAGQTVSLTVREGGSMARTPMPGDGWNWWAWLTAAVGATTFVAAGVVLLIRRRRSTVIPRHGNDVQG